MNLTWTNTAWKEYVEWQDIDRKIVRKINELIKECLRTPFEGTGKPELLKMNYLVIGRDELLQNIASSMKSQKTVFA